MLDWERIYKFDEEKALSLKDYIKSGGLVDWYSLLGDLCISSVLYIPLECNGSFSAGLKFSDVEVNEVNRSRLSYRVLSLLCEMFRNLVDLKSEHVKYKRDVKFYLSVLGHTYALNGVVISFNMQEMRMHVSAYDTSIRKTVKATIYSADEERELNSLLDELHDCKSIEKNDIVVDRVTCEDLDGDVVRVSVNDSFSDFMSKLPDKERVVYLSLNDEVFLKVTKYRGSELHKLSVICESCWFLGYSYLTISNELKMFIDSIFKRDVIKTNRYQLKFFKGDFGVVLRG